MSNSWEDFLKIPTALLEAGTVLMNSGVRGMQASLEVLAGQKCQDGRQDPPVNGPQCLDAAMADFAGRMFRTARLVPWDAAEWARAAPEVLSSARKSFGYLDWSTPRAGLLSLAAPLAAAGLGTQFLLRWMSLVTAVGPRKAMRWANNFADWLSDAGPFVGLQYREWIERHQQMLARRPDDAATRLSLGRLYIKCGLFDDAVRELCLAAKDASTRPAALHWSAVAHYRAARFEQAAADGIAALAANPDNEPARLWLWLTSQSLGGYPENVSPAYRMEVMTGHAPTTVHFEDIAAKAGLDKTSGGRGTAIFDYNNDGYLDIAITAAHGGCTLYRNNGDGTFTDVSIESGLDRCINGFAVIAGDYDNDGFVDLYVSRLGFYSGDGTLYHNNGDGTFSDVTAQAGLRVWTPSFSASWVDYDGDGYLDLFVASNMGSTFERQASNRLFHNNGDGTFTEVTKGSGLDNSVFPIIGSAWGDFENSGRPGLFMSASPGRPALFRNLGDGTFVEVGDAGFNDYLPGGVCCWFDFDNDGWLDILQFIWSDHDDVVYTMKTGHAPQDGIPSRIYRNNRDGTFSRLDREIGIDGCWGSMSGNCADFNNDGRLDIVLGNGSPNMDRLEPLTLLQNDGHKFHNITFSAGLPFIGKSHGTNCADLFGDGRLSILVAAGGMYPGDLLTASLYCPTERPGNYLNVRLRGVKSNRDAIGARVTLIRGESRQMREVGCGTSFGCLPFEQHFGLGAAGSVDALEIRWPSGLTQRVENPPVNETIRITEGAPSWEHVYAKSVP
jgi:hypothetical protein